MDRDSEPANAAMAGEPIQWEETDEPCACCDCTDKSHREHLLDRDEQTQKAWKLYLVDGLPLVKSYKLTHGRLVLCTWCVNSARETFEHTGKAEAIEKLNSKVERILAILNEDR